MNDLQARAPRKVIEELRDILRHIEAAVDGDNDKCNFSCFNDTENRATKERIRLYFQSWVIPHVKAVLAWSEGEATEVAYGRLFRVEDR